MVGGVNVGRGGLGIFGVVWGVVNEGWEVFVLSACIFSWEGGCWL